MSFLEAMSVTVVSVPHLFGPVHIEPGVSLFFVSELLLAGVMAYQAILYPPVCQKEEDTAEL